MLPPASDPDLFAVGFGLRHPRDGILLNKAIVEAFEKEGTKGIMIEYPGEDLR